MCGAGPGDVLQGKPIRLEIDHIDPKMVGGGEEMTNLRVLCNVCNGGMQERNPVSPNRRQVLSEVRRSSRADQLAVRAWLNRKFGRGS